jgi:hypothetical protein
MIFSPVDLAGAIVQAITSLIQIHKINQWAKLVFTMAFAGTGGFLFTTGTSLVSHRPGYEAIGSGLIMASVCMAALYRSSPLTKGLVTVLPEAEATAEINTDLQRIERK